MTDSLVSSALLSPGFTDSSLITGIKARFLHAVNKMRNTLLTYSPPLDTPLAKATNMARSQAKRQYSFPSLAFSSSSSGSFAMDIPLKATPSPPSTSSSTSSSDSDYLFFSNSSSPSSSPSSSLSGSIGLVSHPDWPRSETLSNNSSPSSDDRASCSTVAGGQASCYISDEDLQDLALFPLLNGMRISPRQLAQQNAMVDLNKDAFGEEQQRELPPVSIASKPRHSMRPISGKRRRSKEMKRKPLECMTPISESGE